MYITNPYTGQIYKTDNPMIAKLARDAIANPVRVVNQGQAQQGGLGGEINKISNIFNVLGAGLGGVFTGNDPLTAMRNASAYTPVEQVSFAGSEGINPLLAANPTTNYQLENRWTGQNMSRPGQSSSAGLIDDILAGLVSPFTQAATGALETGALLGQKAQGMTGEQATPLFMTPEEQQAYIKYPALRCGQNLAGLGAYAIPGGSTIASGIGRGLLAGGMAGFGATPTEKLTQGDWSQVLTGAGLGGAAGGIFGGLAGRAARKATSTAAEETASTAGKGLVGKLNNFASDQENVALTKSIGTRAPKFDGGLSGRTLEDYAVASSKTLLNKPIQNVDDLITLANTIDEGVSGKIGEIAQTITKTHTVDELIQPLNEALATVNSDTMRTSIQKAIDEVKGAATNISGGTNVLTDDMIYALKKEFGKLADFAPESQKSTASFYRKFYGKASEILDKDFTEIGQDFKSLNLQSEGALKLQKWADAALERAKGQPAVTHTLQQAGGMGAAAGLGAGGLIGGIPGAIGGYAASRYLQSPTFARQLAKGATTAANTIERGLPASVANINIPNIGNTPTQILQRGLPIGLGGRQMQAGQSYVSPEAMNEGLGLQPTTTTQTATGLPATTATQGLDFDTAYSMAINQYGARTPSEALAIAKELISSSKPAGAGGTQLPATTAMTFADIGFSLNLLDSLDASLQANKDVFDPIMGSVRQLNPYDEGVARVQSLFALGQQIIGKAMEGGVLRKEDEEKYKKMLPQITDTTYRAEEKLKNLRREIEAGYKTKAATLKAVGYDVPTIDQVKSIATGM